MIKPLSEAVIDYNLSSASIYSIVSAYKKKHGVVPDWYIKKTKERIVYVDVDKMLYYDRLNEECKNKITNPDNGLYWKLTEQYGMSNFEIAKYLSSKSERFKNVYSWSSFMAVNMFDSSRRKRMSENKTMFMEFVELIEEFISEKERQGNQ